MKESQPPESKELAELARLRLEDHEAARIAGQLERILRWFQSLDAVDTAGVEPSPYAVALRGVTRSDDPGEEDEDWPRGRAVLDGNCPDRADDQYRVPPVLGS